MQTTYDTSSLQITMSKNVHFNMFDKVHNLGCLHSVSYQVSVS